MPCYSIAFLVVATVAALLGFGIIGGVVALLAKILISAFLVLFLATVFFGRNA